MTDLAGRIFAAALRQDLDHNDIDKLAEIHNHVTTHLFCPISGNVLDSRTAHLVTAQAEGPAQTATGVIHPDVTDADLSQRLETHQLVIVERFDPANLWAAI